MFSIASNTESQEERGRVYRAGIYIRLSKEDGRGEESNSVVNQRQLICGFLKARPEIQAVEEFVDDGYSGVHFCRPGVTRLLQQVKERKIDCIIVKDLSRFGRDYLETGRYLQQIFPFLGVRFIAINDNYDSGGPDNDQEQLTLPFRNLMNDSYSRDLSVKVRSQIDIRRKRGDYIGSFPVFGYRKDEKNKNQLVIDETAASVVRDIFSMKISGKNQKQIAEELNHYGVPSPMEYKLLQNLPYTTVFRRNPKARWMPTAVERILSNEIYTGTMVQGKERTISYKVKKRVLIPKEEWIRVNNTHAPIVSKEDFSLVQKLLFCDTRTPPGEGTLCLLSGLIFCGDCGCSMVRKQIKRGEKSYCYYICSGNKKERNICSSHRVRREKIEEILLEVLRKHSRIFGTGRLAGGWAVYQWKRRQEEQKIRAKEQLKAREEELKYYQNMCRELYEDYKKGILSQGDYEEIRQEYEQICSQLKEAVCSLEEKGRTAEEEIRQREKQPDDGRGRSMGAGEMGDAFMVDGIGKEGEIVRLNRGLLVTVVDRILIFDDRRIRIYFRYQMG